MKTRRITVSGVTAFRVKLLTAMALVVVTLTFLGLYLAEQSVSGETQHDLRLAFGSELALLRTVRDIRHTSLAERCRSLVLKPRIHAALEDNALDLLYPSAKEELGDALLPGDSATDALGHRSIRPHFYRFLDSSGKVISPLNTPEVGALSPDEEKRLNFREVPHEQQNGYLVRSQKEIVEIFATPIISTETGEAIAALVAGFPFEGKERPGSGLQGGMWLGGRLYQPSLDEGARTLLEKEIGRVISSQLDAAAKGLPVRVNGIEHMLFVERLNPESLFPPAYEAGIYPLTDLLFRQWELRRRVIIAGAILLSLGIAASYYISARLAVPVRKLAAVSAKNLTLRERAEAALVIKSNELERTARFSADASHQLKTPVAVLRAGLDELLMRDELSSQLREELSALVHQTFRLSCIIEDLLLLSRLDSGRLQLNLEPVDITRVVETCLDDLQLLHEAHAPEIRIEIKPGLLIKGEMRYTMLIVQNIMDNARKYSTPGEPIRVSAREENDTLTLVVANRGEAIPRASWEPIFERFHRATVGGNIPGHGLGLNLARELARLHGGDVRLVRSDGEWTEFEIRFCTSNKTIENLAAA